MLKKAITMLRYNPKQCKMLDQYHEKTRPHHTWTHSNKNATKTAEKFKNRTKKIKRKKNTWNQTDYKKLKATIS